MSGPDRPGDGAPGGATPSPWTPPWLLYLAMLPVVTGALAALVDPVWVGVGVAAYLLPGVLRLQRVERRRAAELLAVRWHDIMPCYLSVQDRDLRILEINARFRDEFGDCVGEPCYRAYKNRASPCPGCPVLLTFADGEVHTGEETVETRHGEVAHVMLTSAPVRDARGRIVAAMEMSTNITEVKQLQRELAMMGLAVASMAHRAKNILMGLEGGIFVVNEGFETDDDALVDEGWEMVQRNVDHVSRVVKDLLFCSKERALAMQPGVAPAAVVRDVFELFRTRTAEQDIELALELSDEDHTATLDPDGIHSLVVNLVANAVDACRFDVDGAGKRHRIVLGCARAPDGATVLRVSDNGAGIPEEGRHRVFEGFYSTKGTEGTGLGLMVVRHIVQAHGGTIDLESAAGEGTTFTVTLPASPPDGTAAPGSA